MTQRKRIFPDALAAGFLAGALDIAYIIVFWNSKGVSAQQVLQGVASGVGGAASFSGGAPAALLGFCLHMTIAVAMAAAYFLAASRLPILTRRPWLFGSLYGVALYAVMNGVVVPLSASPIARTADLPTHLLMLFPHIALVGLPIALLARFALRDRNR